MTLFYRLVALIIQVAVFGLLFATLASVAIRFLDAYDLDFIGHRSWINYTVYYLVALVGLVHVLDRLMHRLRLRMKLLKPPASETPPAIWECVWWLVLPHNRESFQTCLEDDFARWVAKLGVKRARRRYRLEVLRVAIPLVAQFARRKLGGALESLGKRVSGKSQTSGD
jgi:hypothetical protein